MDSSKRRNDAENFTLVNNVETFIKVYAISYPPLDHEIAGFGGLF